MNWRYKIVEESGQIDDKTQKHAFHIDGQMVWGTALLKILNELGAEGWELVAVNEGKTYILKRFGLRQNRPEGRLSEYMQTVAVCIVHRYAF